MRGTALGLLHPPPLLAIGHPAGKLALGQSRGRGRPRRPFAILRRGFSAVGIATAAREQSSTGRGEECATTHGYMPSGWRTTKFVLGRGPSRQRGPDSPALGAPGRS